MAEIRGSVKSASPLEMRCLAAFDMAPSTTRPCTTHFGRSSSLETLLAAHVVTPLLPEVFVEADCSSDHSRAVLPSEKSWRRRRMSVEDCAAWDLPPRPALRTNLGNVSILCADSHEGSEVRCSNRVSIIPATGRTQAAGRWRTVGAWASNTSLSAGCKAYG